MVRTNDGFKIAELDLEMRGPGEFFGTKQAGLPSFQVASLIRDRDLLELAKKEAAAVLAGPNSEISQIEIDRALQHMRTRWQKDRKSTRLNSSHLVISYAVFCLKKKTSLSETKFELCREITV